MKTILCKPATPSYQIFFYSLMTHSDRALRALAKMVGSPIQKNKVDTARKLAIALCEKNATTTVTIKFR